jgi:peptide-methionine (S)-S-oxide reductase
MRKLYLFLVIAGLLPISIVAHGQSEGTTELAGEENVMSDKTELATLGGGCFWCTEAVYEKIDGVVSVTSGYAGGNKKDPSYEDVLTGKTGHAEVIQIEYDPDKIGYGEILELFWKAHDPTTLNRQGADVGTQYRSIILYHNDLQKDAAEKSIKKASSLFDRPIVTEIKPLDKFYPAENYHQDYYEKNPNAGYCRIVISPKLKKLGLE